MKLKLLILFFFILIATRAFSSQRTLDDHVVEGSLTVHEVTGEPPVLFVDKTDHEVGVNASDPTVDLDIWGGLRNTEEIITQLKGVPNKIYTVLATDYYLSVDTSSHAVTVNLLSIASIASGQTVHIKDSRENAQNNNITVNPDGSDTIDQEPQIIIVASGTSVSIKANTSTNNWEIF